jgi:Kae1-associated kinase Bud32
MKKIIQRGAEAVLYLRGKDLVKERISKGYRLPELDRKIRKQRTKGEMKLMERSRGSGVTVPNVRIESENKLVMEYLRGVRVKDVLNGMAPKERTNVCGKMGGMIAKLHANGIIHGDLTTSNMILKGDKVYLIDFGLGKFSEKVEDQAVDLFLLYEALKSTHFRSLEECWKGILKAYGQNYPNAKDVLKRIENIKKRRRYR